MAIAEVVLQKGITVEPSDGFGDGVKFVPIHFSAGGDMAFANATGGNFGKFNSSNDDRTNCQWCEVTYEFLHALPPINLLEIQALALHNQINCPCHPCVPPQEVESASNLPPQVALDTAILVPQVSRETTLCMDLEADLEAPTDLEDPKQVSSVLHL
jgi:hypothetical protein